MMFQATHEVSENNLPENYTKIIPKYKTLDDDLTDEINWIYAHEHLITGAACEYVWDLYYKEFVNCKILSKNNFYKLIKKELSLKCKIVRISQDATKYCFAEKSKED